ncbi:chorismate mutase [Compostibacter hankyongensis]|uniref:chorismate mutase n=1 Tax=Compostibacter hankyongensis TaxID=1007089 RepID=A0ABP8FDU1_9BACT
MKTKWYYSAAGLILLCLLQGSLHAQDVRADKDNGNFLESSRMQIDSVDHALIQLIGRREDIVRAIGRYKAEKHIAPLQKARFNEVLEQSIAEGKKAGLSPEFIKTLMNAIHEESLRIERDSTAY